MSPLGQAQLGRIKAATPDILFVPVYYEDVAALVTQARRAGIEATVIGSDAWSTAELIAACGCDCEGAYLCNHYSADAPNPLTRAFVDACQVEYGSAPDDIAALDYDAFGLLASALAAGGGLDRTAVLTGMATVSEYRGATGIMRFEDGAHERRKSGVIFDGNVLAHGGNVAFGGQNLIDMEDPSGGMVIQQLGDLASSGGGWLDYMWENPQTKNIDPQAGFVMQVDDTWWLGSGYYRWGTTTVTRLPRRPQPADRERRRRPTPGRRPPGGDFSRSSLSQLRLFTAAMHQAAACGPMGARMWAEGRSPGSPVAGAGQARGGPPARPRPSRHSQLF